MSTALAVAATSFVLVDLLNNGLIDHSINSAVGNVVVNALPPDRVNVGDGSQLALFLYHVTPNPGWRNAGLPSRDISGNRISNTPLALDLHYLLIAYGTAQLHGEILLGYAMQLMHETPVLTRDAIRRSLAAPSLVVGGAGAPPPALLNLYTSELAEQLEMIKITPQLLTIDELSKLWTAFQTQYFRPSAAYQVSVVLIESRASTRSPLPVKSRTIQAVPFQNPSLTAVRSRAPNGPILADQLILPGYDLVLQGTQLKGVMTSVLVDSLEVIPKDADIQNTQIIVSLPVTLEAGAHTVQVIQQVLLGSPPTPRRAGESNGSSFVLHPTITVAVSAVQGNGGDPRSGNLDLTLNPVVGPYQQVAVLLNQLVKPTSPPDGTAPKSYGFLAPPLYSLASPPASPPSPINKMTIPFTGVSAGDYLVRVQVDGAQSPLDTDATGVYSSPRVTVA